MADDPRVLQFPTQTTPPSSPPLDEVASGAFSRQQLADMVAARSTKAAPEEIIKPKDWSDATLEEDLASLLTVEPVQRSMRRIALWGGLLLLLATTGSWLVRSSAGASQESDLRSEVFADATESAPQATGQDVIELGKTWTETVDMLRQSVRAGSRRRIREETNAASAALAIVTRGTELLIDPARVADPLEDLQVAWVVRRLSRDPVARTMTGMQVGLGDSLLVQRARVASTAAVAYAQGNPSAADIARARDLATALVEIFTENARGPWQAFADSLSGVLSQQASRSGTGSEEGGTGDSTSLSMRVGASGQVRRYLEEQGVNVTETGVSQANDRMLVVRGLAQSRDLGLLLAGSPALRRRLTELGFTGLRTEGTDTPMTWNLATGAGTPARR